MREPSGTINVGWTSQTYSHSQISDADLNVDILEV